MDFTVLAKNYIVKAFSSNKKLKGFGDDFFGAFVDWVRPIFLKEDPSAEVVLNLEGEETAKEKIISNKLDQLLKNPSFKSDLETWISKLQNQSIDGKNIIKDSELDIQGDIVIGDDNIGKPDIGNSNIVDNSKIKGKTFRLGDTNKSE